MKIFELKKNGQTIVKIGYCIAHVFSGGRGRDIYRDCDFYNPNSNPLLPKLTLNKVRILINPEARSWLKVMAEDQNGQIDPWIKDGSLDFTSPGKIRLIILNLKEKTEQEMAVQWSWENGIKRSELFQGSEKSTEKEKQIPVSTKKQTLTSTIVLPKEILETVNKSNGSGKRNGKGKSNKTHGKEEEKSKLSKQSKPRNNKLKVQGMGSKEAAQATT